MVRAGLFQLAVVDLKTKGVARIKITKWLLVTETEYSDAR
jgi:hypothetical protein